MRAAASFCLIASLLLFLAPYSRAGNEPPPTGARAVGLGGAAVTLADAWSLTNNVGGLGWLERPTIGLYTDNRFGISAFRTTSLAVALPVRAGKGGTAGFELARFGDNIYAETRAGAGYAYRQGAFSLGVKADLYQVSAEGFASQRAVLVSGGGLIQLRPTLWLGAYGYNLGQARLVKESDQRLPTQLKAGLSYRPGPKVLLNAEVQKTVDLPAAFVAGIEYAPHELLALRTGFNTATEAFNFGLGLRYKSAGLDYALGSQPLLGFSHHLGISYTFGAAPGAAPAAETPAQ